MGGRATPVVELTSEPVWEAVRRGVLLLQRCTTGELHWPPSGTRLCCGHRGGDYLESRGVGTIWSLSVVHRSSHAEPATPYCMVLVELSEGPLVFANLACEAEEQPQVGDAVELTAPVAVGDKWLPMFRIS